VGPFEAIILGIIQGLTEFLPVSSTAHLTLAGALFGSIDLRHPEAWTAFIAVMQLGTLAAVVIYFRRDILRMLAAVVGGLNARTLRSGWKAWPQDLRMAGAIVVGTLPVALVGYTGQHIIEGVLTKSIPVIAGSLITLACLLWLAEKIARHARPVEAISPWDALIIGVGQMLALIPGSSRSGTTITAGLFLGFTREAAARFSFLLSIPAVFASGLYELYKIHKLMDAGADLFALGVTNLVIATIVSAIVGYAAIAWLLKYLVRHTTMVFVWYRIALGILLFVLVGLGML
jgi:undecaprenyl-diphosphatase